MNVQPNNFDVLWELTLDFEKASNGSKSVGNKENTPSTLQGGRAAVIANLFKQHNTCTPGELRALAESNKSLKKSSVSVDDALARIEKACAGVNKLLSNAKEPEKAQKSIEQERKEIKEAVKQDFQKLISLLEKNRQFKDCLTSHWIPGLGDEGTFFEPEDFVQGWHEIKSEVTRMQSEDFGPKYLTFLFSGVDKEGKFSRERGNLLGVVDSVFGHNTPGDIETVIRSLTDTIRRYNSIGK